MNHRGNHRQFQPVVVPAPSYNAAISSSSDSIVESAFKSTFESTVTSDSASNGTLPRSQIPSISDWTLGPGPIKQPILIVSASSTERVTSASSPRRTRSGMFTALRPERKTTKAKAGWTLLSILLVLGMIVGVICMNTRVAADVMLFQVKQPHAPRYLSGEGIVFPLQRFDLPCPGTEQVLAVLVQADDSVKPGQALVRLSHSGLLLSPIGGTVSAVNISPGEMVAANKPLLTIMDESSVIVHVQLPLATFGQVKTGLKAEVSSPAWPGQIFPGVVSAVMARPDAQADTFEVWVSIDGQKEELFSGTQVFVRIPV